MGGLPLVCELCCFCPVFTSSWLKMRQVPLTLNTHISCPAFSGMQCVFCAQFTQISLLCFRKLVHVAAALQVRINTQIMVLWSQYELSARFAYRFDGDGMVHAVHFGEGKAKSYSNHWIRCDRFVEERDAGSNVYMRVRVLCCPD